MPTFYGTLPKEAGPIFGENRLHYPLPGLETKNPYGADGIVEDWETASKVWEYSITSRLTGTRTTKTEKPTEENGDDTTMEDTAADGADGEKPMAEQPLLMTEPGWNPTKNREKAMEIAMEEWGVPAFWLGRAGVLSAFSAGKASALVIDVGASVTSVTPVYEGMMLKKGTFKSSLGGNWLSNQIRLMFAQQDPAVTITPHYLIQSKTPVDAGAQAQAILKTFPNPPADSFRVLQEERVLTEFKESVVHVWEGPQSLLHATGPGTTNEDVARSAPGRPFEMPDGWNQVFTAERHRVIEGLFDAKAAYTSPDSPAPSSQDTLPGLISRSLGAVDVDIRPTLLNNVIVVGGGSLVYGLTRRLNVVLDGMFPGPRVRVFAPGNPVERKFSSWVGGSILASLGSFHQMWVSQKEYQEHGSGIVEKRCK